MLFNFYTLISFVCQTLWNVMKRLCRAEQEASYRTLCGINGRRLLSFQGLRHSEAWYESVLSLSVRVLPVFISLAVIQMCLCLFVEAEVCNVESSPLIIIILSGVMTHSQ